jgi:hypothetical protein
MILSRPNFSERDREYVYNRDQGTCQRCGKRIIFGNRRRDQVGAWEMGHKRAHTSGGTSHLRNIVALCWKCNLQQGTKSFAETNRDMEYDNTGDKVKSFLNDQLLGDGVPSFNLNSARRSRSVDAELEDFRNRLQNNSRDWAQKQYDRLVPLARRYQTTNDSSYEKYYKMVNMILQKYG